MKPDENPLTILGADGQVGRAWSLGLTRQGRAAATYSRRQLDITDQTALAAALPKHHGVVINCAAWTDVDAAESAPQAATAVNATAVGHLARLCRERDCLLVHYSTDYVFGDPHRDARQALPQGSHEGDRTPTPLCQRRPDDPTAPGNVYGRTKLWGEQLIREVGGPHLILRTSRVHAAWGRGFVRAIAMAAARQTELTVIADQWSRATSANSLVAQSWALLTAGARGVWHVTDGGPPCSWWQMATEIAARVNPDCRVRACATADYPPRPAQRPSQCVLDTSATENVIGAAPPWPETLAETVAGLMAES